MIGVACHHRHCRYRDTILFKSQQLDPEYMSVSVTHQLRMNNRILLIETKRFRCAKNVG